MDVLKTRGEKQEILKNKLKKLHILHNKYLLINEKFEVISRLINRNKKNDEIKIKKLELGEQIFHLETLFPDDSSRGTKKRVTSKITKKESGTLLKTTTSIEELNKDKISIPFFFYKLKTFAMGVSTNKSFEGKHRMTLMSKGPMAPFLYEDYQIIKKLI